MAPHDDPSLHELEAEVQAELGRARSSHPPEASEASPAEWLFDPVDVEREEVGLSNLLGAVEALEGAPRPDEPFGSGPPP